MPSEDQNRNWPWLILVALLLWWRWPREKAAPAPAAPVYSGPGTQSRPVDATLPPPIERAPAPMDVAPTQAPVTSSQSYQGGGGTMAGYAKGDTSDAALMSIGPETRLFLNGYRFWWQGNDTGVGLYDAWWLVRLEGGAKVDAVKNQIRAILDPSAPPLTNPSDPSDPRHQAWLDGQAAGLQAAMTPAIVR
jgi:hypothetical protein